MLAIAVRFHALEYLHLKAIAAAKDVSLSKLVRDLAKQGLTMEIRRQQDRLDARANQQ